MDEIRMVEIPTAFTRPLSDRESDHPARQLVVAASKIWGRYLEAVETTESDERLSDTGRQESRDAAAATALDELKSLDDRYELIGKARSASATAQRALTDAVRSFESGRTPSDAVSAQTVALLYSTSGDDTRDRILATAESTSDLSTIAGVHALASLGLLPEEQAATLREKYVSVVAPRELERARREQDAFDVASTGLQRLMGDVVRIQRDGTDHLRHDGAAAIERARQRDRAIARFEPHLMEQQNSGAAVGES